jgi:hypothetical protein
MSPIPLKPLSKKFIVILTLGAIITIGSPFLVLYFDLTIHDNQLNLHKIIDLLHRPST